MLLGAFLVTRVLAALQLFGRHMLEADLLEALSEASQKDREATTRLNLNRNMLKTLPLKIVAFRDLRELQLEDNKLDEVPSCVR